jgi:holo-[acyl-carrier protein] synthase
MIEGLGIDLVEVARIKSAIERRGERFLDRVFRPAERLYCDKRPRRFEHYAVRFAAKEAVLKVLRTGWSCGLGFKDVEVLRDQDGAPSALLSPTAQAWAKKRGIARVLLSLSHSGPWAVAHAVGIAR